MYPVICRIGPLTLYSWGFMLALAFLAGLLTAMKYAKKEGIPPEAVPDLFIYVVIASLIGARLFYVTAFFPQYRNNIISIFYVQQGGLVFFGGLLFALAAVVLYVRSRGLNVWKMLDALSPSLTIGYAIGRVGCYLNGCCYGVNMLGIQQPTQIYSSLAGLVIFILLVRFYNKKKYDGQVFLIGLLLYSIYRFMLEFLRYSPVHIFMLTPSQLLAVPIFFASLYMLWKKNTIS